MKLFFFIPFFIFISFTGSCQVHEASTVPLSIGESVTLHSDILDEHRVLNIYLPYGYSPDSLKQYPVIYLLDGSMDEDFLHITGLVQFGSFSWINLIPETIVVGISNIDRKRDFTHPTDIKSLKKEFPTTGGSALFIQFMEKEVFPYIADNYKITGSRTIIGQSLGGLLATEILFKNPNMFNQYIIISPSLWWDEESLLLSDPTPYSEDKSIYIAVGKEGDIMEKNAKDLFNKLENGKKDNTLLFYNYFEKQNHGDALHLSVYDAFLKLFAE